MHEDPDLTAAVERLATRRRRGQPHLTAEDLEAFHEGDLDPEREAGVRDHLAVCRDCVALLQALEGFPGSLAADDVAVPEAEMERALAATLAAVRLEEGKPVQPEAGVPRGPGRRFGFPGWAEARGLYALAASSLAAVLAVAVGLGIHQHSISHRAAALAERVGLLERQLAQTGGSRERLTSELDRARRGLSAARDQLAESRMQQEAWLRPHVNTPVELLRASRSRGGAAEPPIRVRLPAGVDFLTLILEDPQEETYPAYRLDLHGPRGERIGQAAGLERSRYRNFVVTLPRQILTSGRLSLRLVGLRAGQEKEIGVYAVEVAR